MNNRKAAALARVSTPQQAKDHRHGIPSQLEAINFYAERHGFTLAGQYIDAMSGTIETREAFSRLLTEADQYHAVIIYDLTRLARNEELGHRFLRLLTESGLEVHATTRGIVSDDFQTGAEILLSAQERRSIKARTQAGLLAQARRGLLPQGIRAYGYRNITGTGRAMIDPREAEVVRRIFAMSADGIGYRVITKALNDEGIPSPQGTLWHHGTPGKLIRNPVYKGEHHWRHKTGLHIISVPPIVTPAEWDAAQKRGKGPKPSAGFVLSGHLRCGACGRAMGAYHKVPRYKKQDGTVSRYKPLRYYRCGSRNYAGGHCGTPVPYAAKLERLVEAELRSLLSSPDRLRAIIAAAREKPIDDARLASLREREARLLEALTLGGLTAEEFTRYRGELRGEMQALIEPEEVLDAPIAELVQGAASLSLRELLEAARVTAFYTPNEIRLTLDL